MGSKEGKAKALNEKEIKVLKALINSRPHKERNIAIFMLGLQSGLRAFEIATLRLSHIIENNGDLRDSTNIKGKGSKVSRIYFNSEVRKALQAWLDVREDDIASDSLFYTQKKQPLRANYIARLMYELMQDANIKEASSHSLRRTYANNLLEEGANIRDIKELMRHSSIATTQIYFESSETQLSALAEKLAKR